MIRYRTPEYINSLPRFAHVTYQLKRSRCLVLSDYRLNRIIDIEERKCFAGGSYDCVPKTLYCYTKALTESAEPAPV